jgi:hypothetical protein
MELKAKTWQFPMMMDETYFKKYPKEEKILN